jgi:hypothetical protein
MQSIAKINKQSIAKKKLLAIKNKPDIRTKSYKNKDKKRQKTTSLPM